MSDNRATELGSRLKTLRKMRKLSQDQVSKAVGICRKTCSKYETGETNISAVALAKVSAYYSVSSDFLLGLTSTESPFLEDIAICNKIGCSYDTYLLLKDTFNNPDTRKKGRGFVLEQFLEILCKTLLTKWQQDDIL